MTTDFLRTQIEIILLFVKGGVMTKLQDFNRKSKCIGKDI